jgi:hypothetical protein
VTDPAGGGGIHGRNARARVVALAGTERHRGRGFQGPALSSGGSTPPLTTIYTPPELPRVVGNCADLDLPALLGIRRAPH